jgi:hypothetical protein
MGAQDFFVRAKGTNSQHAFDQAVSQAQYKYGHGGYTGTIAEKHSFVEIQVPAGEEPASFAGKLLDEDDDRVCDKWGPAGCVKVKDGEWLFFGLASS